jgi:solute:Na+ symporter, SSS family
LTLILLFVGYLLIILAVNVWLARRVGNAGDFFQAGRRFGAWPMAISFVASWFGAASTLGQVQKIHAHGLSALWALVVPSVLSCLVIWRLLAHRVARQQVLSLPQAIQQAYGRWGRFGLALTVLASSTAFIGTELLAAGTLFEQAMHWPKHWSVPGFGLLVVIYAAMAGFWTVVLTDFLHFALFTATVIYLAWFGWPDVLAVWQYPPHATFWHWLPLTPTDWGNTLALTTVFVLGWSIDPLMWQRMGSVQQPAQATQAAGQATLILCGLFTLVTLIGVASTHSVGGSAAPLVVMAMQTPLSAWVLLGIVTALSSTIDSSLNVGSLTLTHDLVGTVKPGLSDRQQVALARLATLLMLIPACALALTQTDIIKTLWISADIYVCGLFWPLMGILFPALASRRGGQWAMAVGGVFITVNSLLTTLGYTWLPWPYTSLVGFLLSGLAFSLGRR